MNNLYQHQVKTVKFFESNPRVLCTSDPGTGKTLCVIETVRQRRRRTLVFAPKSILQPSWGNDIEKFAPDTTYAIAYADNRQEAFESGAKIVITNIDAAVWVAKNKHLLKDFETLVIDESTAYKSPTSQRSKAMVEIAKMFDYRIALTGTPTPNGIIDIWHQIKILDDGAHLGGSFWKFRSMTHNAIPRGQFTDWVEREGINDAVFGLISDMSIRFKLEDVIDMPERVVTDISFDLSPKHLALYRKMKTDMILHLKSNTVTAVNKAVLAAKLAQVASGAVYGDTGYEALSPERYELILDLIEQRDQCVVAFHWGHQRDILTDLAAKRGVTFAVIDGEVSSKDRTEAVAAFQAGMVKVIFAHPASASHGLTLTKGTTTIWASPTYNAEHFEQFNARIYRAGQTKRTETILISAAGTIDAQVYDILKTKQSKMTDLLELLES